MTGRSESRVKRMTCARKGDWLTIGAPLYLFFVQAFLWGQRLRIWLAIRAFVNSVQTCFRHWSQSRWVYFWHHRKKSGTFTPVWMKHLSVDNQKKTGWRIRAFKILHLIVNIEDFLRIWWFCIYKILMSYANTSWKVWQDHCMCLWNDLNYSSSRCRTSSCSLSNT